MVFGDQDSEATNQTVPCAYANCNRGDEFKYDYKSKSQAQSSNEL